LAISLKSSPRFQSQYRRFNITGNFTGSFDFNLFPGKNISADFSLNNDVRGMNISLNFTRFPYFKGSLY